MQTPAIIFQEIGCGRFVPVGLCCEGENVPLEECRVPVCRNGGLVTASWKVTFTDNITKPACIFCALDLLAEVKPNAVQAEKFERMPVR